jgi:hypothetical protein
MLRTEFLNTLMFRVAEIAVGPSALRNQVLRAWSMQRAPFLNQLTSSISLRPMSV